MEVFTMPQRSEEWFNIRKGVFTASESGLWVSKEKRTKKDEGAAYSAICEKLAQKSGAEMPPRARPTWEMKRGVELEDDARKQYEEETGRSVEEVGFVLHANKYIGASPDGFIEERKGLVEIKVPSPKTHVKYLLNKQLFIDYCNIQAHHQMAASGTGYCDIYAYCPCLPSILIRIERDAFTEDLLRGLIRLSKELKQYEGEMSSIWDAMKSRLEQQDK